VGCRGSGGPSSGAGGATKSLFELALTPWARRKWLQAGMLRCKARCSMRTGTAMVFTPG